MAQGPLAARGSSMRGLSMRGLSVRGLVVRYPAARGAGGVTAVDDVTLDIAPGEVFALLGPSGCGKSSLLRAVAGLEPAAAGTVAWDGVDLAGVPVHRRGFGLMFQDGQLFPHRDVAGNVEFGLRMAGLDRAAREARVHELLDVVGLAGYERRPVATLSGGEQQRVALARSLAPSPRLLLLDEPLSALDRALRERLAEDLRAALTATGTTALLVTHDQTRRSRSPTASRSWTPAGCSRSPSPPSYGDGPRPDASRSSSGTRRSSRPTLPVQRSCEWRRDRLGVRPSRAARTHWLRSRRVRSRSASTARPIAAR